MIYFAQRPEGGLIKIGTSISVKQRITAISVLVKSKVVVLAVMEGSVAEESLLHGRFAHLRVEGEWFNPEPELINFIRDHGNSWDGIDRVPENGDPDELLSICRAAILLDVNRMWLSGYLAPIDAIDSIKTYPVGTSIGIKRRDLEKIEVPRKKKRLST